MRETELPRVHRYTLAAWARRQGLTARQARYAVSKGDVGRLQLPPEARLERLASGRWQIVVPLLITGPHQGVAFYARAFHRAAATGVGNVLDRQIAALEAWAQAHGVLVLLTVREVASPLELPQSLLSLVVDPTIPTIVVTDQARLGWFTAPLLEALLAAQGRQLIALGQDIPCARDDWIVATQVASVLQQRLAAMQRTLDARLPLPPRESPAPLTPLPP